MSRLLEWCDENENTITNTLPLADIQELESKFTGNPIQPPSIPHFVFRGPTDIHAHSSSNQPSTISTSVATFTTGVLTRSSTI